MTPYPEPALPVPGWMDGSPMSEVSGIGDFKSDIDGALPVRTDLTESFLQLSFGELAILFQMKSTYGITIFDNGLKHCRLEDFAIILRTPTQSILEIINLLCLICYSLFLRF